VRIATLSDRRRRPHVLRTVALPAWLAYLAVGRLCAVGALPPPTVVLEGRNARRVDAFAAAETPKERPRPGVIMRGREVLEWSVPKTTRRDLYVFVLDVRTGSTPSNPVNLVPVYRLWTMSTEGRESEHVGFELEPGNVPKKTSKVYPVFMGRIVSTAPLPLEPGMRIRVTAKASWAEVRRLAICSAPLERRLVFDLRTPQPFHLFRAGRPLDVRLRVHSWLERPVRVRLATRFESPYGAVLKTTDRTIEVAPGAERIVRFAPKTSLSGCHFFAVTARWRTFEFQKEIALGVVSVPPATALNENSIFGVHPAGLMQMYQSGFKWIRLWDTGDVWSRHERGGKGKFEFAVTEAKVNEFRRQGFEVLAVLAYTPAWASRHPEIGYHAGAGAPFPPKNIRDWEDYCREYMTRFRGRIRFFEVWNEPNTGNAVNLKSGFFRGTVSDYVDLLRAAHEAARQVGPEIRIVGCSGTGDFLRWTEAVLAAGGGPFMDVLSFHAYTTPRSPEEANLEGRLEQLHRIMKKHGVGDLPIWNTETGYWLDRRRGARPALEKDLLAEAPSGLAPNWKASWPFRPVTEVDAAAWTVRHYLLNAAHGVRRLFWYSSASSGFPLLCADSSLRLPCFAVAAASNELDGFSWIERLDLGLRQLHLQLWGRNGEVRGVAWYAGRGHRTIVFPRGARFDVFDMWGNPAPRSLRVTERGVLLAAGRDPLWLHGKRDWFAAARVDASDLVIPVTDCYVVRSVDPKRPVKEHTSPKYHGDRRVFGLPDSGDAIGWKLAGIQPGAYRVEIELRTGSAGNLYGCLDWYRVTAVTKLGEQPLHLGPVADPVRRPVPIRTKEGGNRAYGWAQCLEPVILGPGDEIRVTLRAGFGFVGSLRLCELRKAGPQVFTLPAAVVVPKIDGVPDAADRPRFTIRDRRQVVIGVADPFASTSENDAWKGRDDLSAVFSLARTENGLYLFVDITDGGGLHPSRTAAYNGDGIEVFLDLRSGTRLGTAARTPGVHQFFIRAPAENGGPVRRVEGDAPPETAACAVRTPHGWRVEILIPVADLKAGRQIGFDLAVDDDDTGGGRKTQMVWHGTADNFQDPSRYARFRVE